MKGSLLLAMLMVAPAEAEVRDRARAQSVLETARNAVKQADAKAARREEAAAKLKEAEAHFQSARYEEAAQAADGAWKLLSTSAAPQPTHFTVAVDDEGSTTVTSHSGQPVRVEGQGVTKSVSPNESMRVDKGQPPPEPRPLLGVPLPTQPSNKLKLTVQPAKGGLGPITLAWKAVEGATGYEVELVPVRGEKRVLTANAAQLKVALPAGAYRWSVRALAREARSEASPEHGFEVAEAPAKSIKLEVQPSKWK
jgi:hypothetical protein